MILNLIFSKKKRIFIFFVKFPLQKELERAWKISDASLEKEQSAKEAIQSLKQEIANLTKLVEQGAGLTMGQEQNVNELVKNRDDLIREKDRLIDEVVKLREVLEDSQSKNLDYEKKIEEANNTISQVRIIFIEGIDFLILT